MKKSLYIFLTTIIMISTGVVMGNDKEGINSKLCVLPKGPDVNEYQCFYQSNFYAVLSTSEIPAEAAKIWFDIILLWDESGSFIPEVIEDKKLVAKPWEVMETRKLSSEREYNIGQTIKYNFATNYASGFSQANSKAIALYRNIVDKNANIYSEVEAQKPMIQDLLDTSMNK
jgi:hypothetical protein